MNGIDWEHPIIYEKDIDDNYGFYFFKDINSRLHISIDVRYKYSISNFRRSFAQPIINNKIDWEAYGNRHGLEKELPLHVKKFADKLCKLIKFL